MTRRLLEQVISKTVKEAVSEWDIDCQIESKSPATLRFYRQFIRPFIDTVGPDTKLENITSVAVKQYLASRQDSHEYAHAARFRALRSFLNWCKKQGYIVASPLNIKPPRLPEKVIPDFTTEDIKAMLKACDGTMALRDRALVLFLYDTGIRLGEVQRMTLGDLNLIGHQVTIHGKGNKQRVLHISDTTTKAVWLYLKSRKKQLETVWLTEESRPIQTGGIYQALKRIILRAGIKGKKASPHVFRHSFASSMLSQGMAMDELQYLLGHNSLAMVERYARASKARRAIQAQAKHSPVDSL